MLEQPVHCRQLPHLRKSHPPRYHNRVQHDGSDAILCPWHCGVAGGNLFISDVRIRKVTPAGVISIVAGNGTSGSGGMAVRLLPRQLIQSAFTIDAVAIFHRRAKWPHPKGHARRHHLTAPASYPAPG